jgi:hypothetical protein
MAPIVATAFLCILATISGCASMLPRLPAEPDPIRYIPEGASLYARFTKPALLDVAPSILSNAVSKSIAPILARSVAAAIGARPSGASGMDCDIAVVGDFSKNTVDLALSLDASFRREGGAFLSGTNGIEVASPADRLILARVAGIEDTAGIADPAGSVDPAGIEAGRVAAEKFARRLEKFDPEGSSPLPPRFGSPYGGDIFIWIPDPLAFFASFLPTEGFEIPIQGIRILASRLESADGDGSRLYESSLSFVMKDSESARIYRPTLRFAWFALSAALARGKVDGAYDSEVKFVLENEDYTARGMTIPASAYSALFRMTSPQAK